MTALLTRARRSTTTLDDLALDLDGTEDGEPDQAADDDSDDDATDDGGGQDSDAVPAGPLGDRDILADLGVSEKELLALDGAEALSEIADALGAAEVLETVR